MKTLFLIRGLPGAGKSTLAEHLFWLFSCYKEDEGRFGQVCLVAADDFMVDGDGYYKWQPELLPECHRECYATAESAIAEGVEDVIVHNTFTTEKEMQPYMDAAHECGYRVVRLIVENTHGNTSVHNVPDKTLEAMRNRFSIKL